ncbi:PIN domain-containing protein [Bacillus sp. FSL L8-0199]|uniref:DUF4935 domain-containing protein n=1 Tax=Bacillus cereus TaxID=1396 RepID=A0A9X0SM61_BACCE|nr:PIN domain-containing protein [Bacillus cereus]KXY37012.1 hypothetical protein AT268_34010 [Bacillus cereus]
MLVVLDANVIKKNFMLTSIDFNNLIDYLIKTQSKLIIPQIVWEEIQNLFKKDLEQRYEDYKNGVLKLNVLLMDPVENNTEINVDKKTADYMDYIKDRLSLKDEGIVKYKQEYLPEVVNRAIHRIKPCSPKGEEFRDTLLWLTVLDIAKENSDEQLVLISHNTKEFAADNNKEVLHPDLEREVNDLDLDVQYYNSLGQFIQRHATKIKFVDETWIKDQINIDEVNDNFLHILNENEEDSLMRYAENRFDNCTGYINVCGAFLDIEDFFVYEKSDGSLYLELILSGEIEVEVEIEEEIEKEREKYEYEYVYDSYTHEFTVERVPKYEVEAEVLARCAYIYPDYELKLGAVINNKKLEKYTIKEFGRL